MIGISVAANKEWNYVKECYKDSIKELSEYIYGEYFETTFNGKPVLVYKCGARKSNASASTQYIIDQFSPEKIILIGTAAGINKQYSLLDILVPDTAIQGDCSFIEKGEPFEDRFITRIDLSEYDVTASFHAEIPDSRQNGKRVKRFITETRQPHDTGRRADR